MARVQGDIVRVDPNTPSPARNRVDQSKAMEYRYLRARGALNEAELRPSNAPSERHGHVHEPSIPRKLIELFPESLARENLAIPIKLRGETLVVATVDHL